MSWQAVDRVLRFSKAKKSARLLLIQIASHAHKDGSGAFPAVESMVEETGLTRRHVQRLLRQLEADGELRIKERPGQSHMMTVLVGATSIRPKRAKDEDAHDVQGATFQARGGDISAPPMSKMSPEPSLSRQVEPSSLLLSQKGRSDARALSVEELAQRIVVRASGPWRAALGRISAATPAPSFVRSFSNTTLELDGDTARVIAPGPFAADLLRSRYGAMIRATLGDVLGRGVVVSIVASTEAA